MKQIRPIENSIDMIDMIDILIMPNIIKTIDMINTVDSNFTISTIVDERKYKTILHNQTVQINRSLYYGTSAEKHRTSCNYGRKQ